MLQTGRQSPKNRPHEVNIRLHGHMHAKQLALQLLGSAGLIRDAHALAYHQRKVSSIMEIIDGCQEEEKGEVYLLLCRSCLCFGQTINFLLQPHQILQPILLFLNALLSDEHQTSQGQTGRLLRHAYSNPTGRKVKTEKKVLGGGRRLMDLLLVDRIDEVIRVLVEMVPLHQYVLRGSTAQLINFFKGSISVANKYIQNQQQKQLFCANIQIINSSLQVLKLKQSQEKTLNTYMLRNQARKSALQQKKRHSTLKRSFRSSDRPSRSTTSDLFSMGSSQKALLRQLSVRKDSVIVRRNHLAGGRNNSQRTSHHGLSEEHISKRLSGLLGQKLNIGEFGHSKSRNRRKPGLHHIDCKLIEKAVLEEAEEGGRSEVDSSQQTQQQDLEMNELDRTIHNFLTGRVIQIHRRFKPFYVYLVEKGMMYLAKVYQNSRSEGIFLVTMLLNRTTVTRFVPEFESQRSDKELFGEYSQGCSVELQSKLPSIMQLTRNSLGGLSMISSPTQDSSQGGLTLRVAESKVVVVLCWVRNIRAYLINSFTFPRSALFHYNQKSIIKQILSSSFKSSSLELCLTRTVMDTYYRTAYESQEVTFRKGFRFSMISNAEKYNIQDRSDNFKIAISNAIIKQMPEVSFRFVLWAGVFDKAIRRLKKYQVDSIIEQEEDASRARVRKTRSVNQRTSIKKKTVVFKGSDKGQDRMNSEYNMDFLSSFKTSQSLGYISPVEPKVTSFVDLPQQKKRGKKKKQTRREEYVETIRTKYGYRLVKHVIDHWIDETSYSHFFGHGEKNPQNCLKINESGQPDSNMTEMYLRQNCTIHGRGKRQRGYKLITFTKKLYGERGMMGYVVSRVQLIADNDNQTVFLETYWQSKQKYFIFQINSEVFSRLTDINTNSYPSKPLVGTQSAPTKKKNIRTSMAGTLMRSREGESHHRKSGMMSKPRRFKVSDDELIRQELGEDVQAGTRFTPTIIQQNKIYKSTNSTNSYTKYGKSANYTSKQIRSVNKTAIEREVFNKLRNKLVRLTSFTWKNHCLTLTVRHPSQQNEGHKLLECQGDEVLLKNVYPGRRQRKEESNVTQLILVKFTEKNMCSLGSYNLEALSKMYLERQLIKNSMKLQGKFISTYKFTDDVFTDCPPFSSQSSSAPPFGSRGLRSGRQIQRSLTKSTSSNVFEQYARLKYGQLIRHAGDVSIQNNRSQVRKTYRLQQSFYLANQFPCLNSQEFMLLVQYNSAMVKIKRLDGEIIKLIHLRLVRQYLDYLYDLRKPFMRRVLVERILKDPDLLNICAT